MIILNENNMDEIIWDAEFNGLNPDKIWVLYYNNITKNIQKPVLDYDEIKDFFYKNNNSLLIGHNIIRFDVPCIEKILNLDLSSLKFVDTLGLSWYNYPKRVRHGLEEWGEYFNVPKIKIEDWYNLSVDDYIKRCEQDVKINSILWKNIKEKLNLIYEDRGSSIRLIDYLTFKLSCARLQEESGWKLDKIKALENLEELNRIKTEKENILKEKLPRIPVFSKKTKPKSFYKKDGSLSKKAITWSELVKEYKKDIDIDEINIQTGWEEPNPNSHSQIKNWLFSIGWKPDVFKKGSNGEVPQITQLNSHELCESVKSLVEIEPSVKELEGLFTINHRIAILEGFLRDKDENDYLKAKVAGFTNTLRFKHQEIVNLPSVDKPLGEYIRPVLVCEDGWELCGADLKGLEDRTKQHYIWEFDPNYVREMDKQDWDPHLDIALLGGIMTKEEVDKYKNGDNSKELKLKRHGAKTTNYACTYKAFPPKIARTANISIEDAKILWDAYWKRNWSIKKIEENTYVKKIKNEVGEDEFWLYNPVSKFYYNLRDEKDKFSTLNQSTGSFCFDCWLGFVLKKRKQLTAQFHDEGVWQVKKGHREEFEKILKDSIDETNEYLSLNRKLEIDIHWGTNYGEIH